MASIKKKSGGGGGANWMDTYGDMVTLLLCFFVLLYSISTVDQNKWILLVQSFNKDALVNVDDQPELARKFRVMSIPTLMVFKDGELSRREVGVRSKEEILEMVR